MNSGRSQSSAACDMGAAIVAHVTCSARMGGVSPLFGNETEIKLIKIDSFNFFEGKALVRHRFICFFLGRYMIAFFWLTDENNTC